MSDFWVLKTERRMCISLLEAKNEMINWKKWLEYNPQVVSYARGDIGPSFAATYRLPLPKDAPFTIGYTFEGKPHDYLPDVVGIWQGLLPGTAIWTAKASNVCNG